MRLHKRGDVWFAAWYEHGKRQRRSTQCTDRRAAEAVAIGWERAAADPAGAAARGVTLQKVLELLVAQRHELAEAGTRSADTVAFYARKSGVLLTVFGQVFDLEPSAVLASRIDAAAVDAYTTRRRAAWADPKHTRHVTEGTVFKELSTLRVALKLAKRRGLWRGDIEAVLPAAAEVAAGYVPRKRWLSPEELEKLLLLLTGRSAHARHRKDRGARVAFAVATGAEWGALERAQRVDVRLGDPADLVLVRGTKRPSRWRTVPVLLPASRTLLRAAVKAAEGEGDLLFTPWTNSNRDLRVWCARAGIARCSWNDLRRSFAQWLVQGGVANELVAPAMGHTTTAMVQKVYGRLSPEHLAVRIAAQLSGTPAGQTAGHEGDSGDSKDDSRTSRSA